MRIVHITAASPFLKSPLLIKNIIPHMTGIKAVLNYQIFNLYFAGIDIFNEDTADFYMPFSEFKNVLYGYNPKRLQPILAQLEAATFTYPAGAPPQRAFDYFRIEKIGTKNYIHMKCSNEFGQYVFFIPTVFEISDYGSFGKNVG